MRGHPRSVDRGTGRPGIQPRKSTPERRRRKERRKPTPDTPISRGVAGLRAVRDPGHARTHLAREPGEPLVARGGWRRGPHREVYGRTPMMDGQRQSDRPGGPTKAPNNPGGTGAEGPEGSGLAEGNLRQQNAPRTQRRIG